MNTFLRFGLILALGALSLAGCGTTPPSPPEPSPSASEAAQQQVVLYWVEADDTSIRLVSETQSVPVADATASTLVSRLVAGELAPVDENYTSLWGNGSRVNSVTIEGDLATVDLHLGALNYGAESESVAIGQIVWTLTEIDPTVTRVQLLVDGDIVESLAGHVDTTAPISR